MSNTSSPRVIVPPEAPGRASNLLGRFATPEEVASLSVYVASPQASASTGSALRVDGGTVETIA